MGSPDFSLPSLKALAEKSDLIAVVSAPDKKRGRGQELSATPVKKWALDNNIPCFTPTNLRKECSEKDRLLKFLDLNPIDLNLVVAYGYILPESFLSLASKTSINVHASLLPRWRGAAPIQRSLEAGDKVSGVCLQRIVQKLDAGDILLSKEYSLQENDNSLTLFSKLSFLGAQLVSEFLEKLPNEASQQDESKVCYAHKIQKDEGFWSCIWSSRETLNKIKAFALWPKVSAKLKDGPEIKLLSGRLCEQTSSLQPGSIFIDNKKVFLCCDIRTSENNLLEISEIQVEGKKPSAAFIFFNNYLSLNKTKTALLVGKERKL